MSNELASALDTGFKAYPELQREADVTTSQYQSELQWPEKM